MVDPLVVSFGDAVVKYNDPAILSRIFFEDSKTAAKKAVLSGQPSEAKVRELELKLWDLCVIVVDNHISGEVPPAIIQEWLSSNLNTPQKPASLQQVHWNYSLDRPELNRQLPIGTKQDPLKGSEEAFFKYAFELVLSGEQKSAQEAAEQTKNWLAKMVLSAGDDIKQQKMLHDSCLELSKSAAGVSERAFYGLLSGNVSASAQLCESWEQLLLAYTRSDVPISEFETKSSTQLRFQESDEVKFFRRIILAILSGRVDELVERLLTSTPPNPSSLVREWQFPWVVRVLLHLQLLLSLAGGSSTGPSATLNVLYIEHQLTSSDEQLALLKFVPRYVGLLNVPMQVSVYSKILYHISDEQQQREQLKLAVEYSNINLESVLIHVIELSFSDFDSSDTGVVRFCGALKWLLASQKILQNEKLLSLTCPVLIKALYLLLVNGQETGAILLASRFDLNEVKELEITGRNGVISKFYENDVDIGLLEQYYLLVSALADLREFKVRGGIEDGYLGARTVYDAVDASLEFGLDFINGNEISLEDVERIKAVRAQWLPIVVSRYLELLDPSQSGCALKVATKIADENQKLYELFDVGLMERLVKPLLDLLV